MKKKGEPIVMITAYDYPSALLYDQTGVDMILVGDSLGMVVHGFETTLPVTMDMMVLHAQAVMRGVSEAFVVGDMPFMSYQANADDALRNAGRLLAEGGVNAVKLEGGERVAPLIERMVAAGIAVQGHIGLTPQSVSAMGGFRVQGKSLEVARQLIADAHALEEAGVLSIVLEGVPGKLATLISQRVSVPTIGIGAGVGCDGQVLVSHDLLGLYDRMTPSFVKQYGRIATAITEAVEAYMHEVREHSFPTEAHTFSLNDEVWATLEAEYGG
jgi:3-methyl-2-oxobutanoate hydroxymethyltransferase